MKWLLIVALLSASSAGADLEAADEAPETPADVTDSHWGVGAAAGWINDYPGAAQGRMRYLAIPTYKGKHLTIDRQEGVRGDLLSESRLKFSVSFSFLFPTSSHNIPIRSGMPNLDWTLQLGPELQLFLHRSPSHTMFLRLPFRFVASTDFKSRFESREWNFAPSLRNLFYLGHGWGEIGTRLELDYASEAFNDYFFQVDTEHQRPGRPAFNAREGLMGVTVGINYSYYDSFPWIYFVGANVYLFSETENRMSPLLQKNTNHSVLAGLIKYF